MAPARGRDAGRDGSHHRVGAVPPPLDHPELAVDRLRARRDALVADIRHAFADVSREGGVSVSEAYVIDNYGTDEERADARASDTDTHWSQIDPAIEDPCGSALTFMDAIGYRYYIPAFMCATLQSAYEKLGPTRNLVNAYLDPAHHFRPFYRDTRLSLLTGAQRNCIARCALLVAELDYVHDPTDSYVPRAIRSIAANWLNDLAPNERVAAVGRWPELTEPPPTWPWPGPDPRG